MAAKIKNIIIFIPFFLLLNVSSCGLSQEIMGLTQNEATDKLKEGDISFILDANLPKEFPAALELLGVIARIYPDALFFAGLLTENEPAELAVEEIAVSAEITFDANQDTDQKDILPRSILFYTAALGSESIPIRREASEKLILPCLKSENSAFVLEVLSRLTPLPRSEKAPSEFNGLRAACLYRLGFFDELEKMIDQGDTAWEEIIPLVGSMRKGVQRDREKTVKSIKSFFMDIPLTRDLLNTVWAWALDELDDIDRNFFRPGEEQLIQGRAAVARSAYGQGLRYFRLVLGNESQYPKETYFFPYPELVTSLGRAYQYTPRVQVEGSRLFNAWIDDINPARFEPAYYRLLHYAGRIERVRERYAESNARFLAAARVAPDGLQKDSCIWYAIMNTLADKPENAAALVKETLPLMSSPPYFIDALERLSRYLSYSAKWDTMLELYEALRHSHHTAASQYAWILGRVIQEGRFETDRTPEEFFKVALEEGNTSLYYRAMSASRLNIPLILAEAAGPPQISSDQAEMNRNKSGLLDPIQQEVRFILDFFDYRAGSFVMPYLREIEEELPVFELRKIAKALGDYGRRGESLSLISRYMDRENYELVYEDLLLYYPRHFQELIESNAKKAGFGAEILFGLVRTESAFMPEAVSWVGATGLGQFMPATAAEVAARIAQTEGIDYRIDGKIDLRNPEINAHLSANYLRYLIDQLGSPMPALLAYNGGIGRVRRWRNAGAQLPDDLFLETVEITETRDYGRKVLAAAAMYGWLYYDMSMEAVIADIYR